MTSISSSAVSGNAATSAVSGMLTSSITTSLESSKTNIATSLNTTTTPSPTPTTNPTSVLTTYPPTTYLLPTLTSWGTTPDTFSNFDLGDRILQLITGGSNGERIVRGFLLGVAIGIIIGGALCCWVPCFGRRRQERRLRRRQQRQAAERQAQENRIGGTTTEPRDEQQQRSRAQTSDPPTAGRSYVRIRWDRTRRRRQS